MKGTLAEQLERRSILEPSASRRCAHAFRGRRRIRPRRCRRAIDVSNGFGGFTRDGHEYVITLTRPDDARAVGQCAGQSPFRHGVSESGSAYTWVENAHEFRLTPWNNDPVQDTTGEAFLHSR
jgi:cyclic beta-1,2-glucan synthetase